MFEAALPGLRALHPDQYDTAEKLQAAWLSFLQNMALSNVARKKGYADTPDMRARVAQMLAQELVLKEAETARPVHSVTETEIRDFFEAHKASYAVPAMIGAQEIILKFDPSKPVHMRDQLSVATNIVKSMGASVVDAATFMTAARMNSDPESLKANGGHLGIFPARAYRGQKPLLADEAVEALLKLESIGRVTGPIVTSNEIRVLRLTALRHATTPDYKTLKESIRYRLYSQARERRIQELAAESGWALKRSLDSETLRRLLPPSGANAQRTAELPPTPANFGVPEPEPVFPEETK